MKKFTYFSLNVGSTQMILLETFNSLRLNKDGNWMKESFRHEQWVTFSLAQLPAGSASDCFSSLIGLILSKSLGACSLPFG